MSNRLTKSDLIHHAAEAAGVATARAAAVIDAALAQITTATAAGQTVQLQGFGSFVQRNRAARTGRNPQTGAPVEIPASQALAFKPAKPRRA